MLNQRKTQSLEDETRPGRRWIYPIAAMLLLMALPAMAQPNTCADEGGPGISYSKRAALEGVCGIEVQSDGSGSVYTMMNSKAANYPEITMYFWFDRATATLAPGNWVRPASLTDASGTDLAAFEFRFDDVVGDYKWRGVTLDAGVEVFTDEGIVDSALDGYLVTLQWRSSAVGGGMFQAMAHGQPMPSLQDLSNDYIVRTVRLGALTGTAGMAPGTWYALDHLRLISPDGPIGAAVDFLGVATDPQDGDLAESITWSSDIDGVIFSGAGPDLFILSPGIHTITATVTDAAGDVATDESPNVEVVMSNDPPEVFILSPAPNSTWGN